MSKHTPGPWQSHNVHVVAHDVGMLEEDGYNDHCIVDAVDGRNLVEARNNAHLIAAAPDLLAVLREQTRLIEQFLSGALVVFPSAVRGQAADAVAKAEGRAS